MTETREEKEVRKKKTFCKKKEKEIFILCTSLYWVCTFHSKWKRFYLYSFAYTIWHMREETIILCFLVYACVQCTCLFFIYSFFRLFYIFHSFSSIVIRLSSLRHACALDFYSYFSSDNYLCSYNSRHSSSFVFRWVLLVFSSSVNPTQRLRIRATCTHTTASFTLTPCVNSLTRTLTLSL